MAICVALFGHVFEEGYRHQQVFSLNQGFYYAVFDVQLVIQINITWEDSVVMRVTIRLLLQFVVMRGFCGNFNFDPIILDAARTFYRLKYIIDH